MTTPSIAQIEHAAQLAADDRMAAEDGCALLRQLAAQWHEQGYNARAMGLGQEDLWNRDQRIGWREADAEISAVHAEQESRLATGEGYSWNMPTGAAVVGAVRSTASRTPRRGGRHGR